MDISPDQHTPKRRRIADPQNPTDHDFSSYPYSFNEDAFHFSPPETFSHSPPSGSQDSHRSSWGPTRTWQEPEGGDISRRLQDAVFAAPDFNSFMTQQHPSSGPGGFDFANPPRHETGEYHQSFVPPPMPIPYHHRVPHNTPQAGYLRDNYHHMPRFGIPANPPPIPRDPTVSSHPSTPQVFVQRKGGVTLTLSRASDKSINELPEHKRECPACQLDFEPNNFLAVISCCGTAMHANCLSAWVNSATYAKTKICMKCRKVIDARRPMNHIVPPVNDKSWDENVDFNAPEYVKEDTKIELDVTGRTDPMYRRFAQMRRDSSFYQNRRRATSVVNEADIPPPARASFQALQRDLRKENEEQRAKYRAARADWRAKFDVEARAVEAIGRAREMMESGAGGLTVREVDGLTARGREAKEEQEAAHVRFRMLGREQEALDKKHEERLLQFLSESVDQERRHRVALRARLDTNRQQQIEELRRQVLDEN